MRIKELNVGVESVSRWRAEDELHLPDATSRAPGFLPLYRPLHEILNRPTLDERLSDLLQPTSVSPELMEPSVLSQTRIDVRTLLAAHAAGSFDKRRAVFEQALTLLDRNMLLDEEVRISLAMLLRG